MLGPNEQHLNANIVIADVPTAARNPKPALHDGNRRRQIANLLFSRPLRASCAAEYLRMTPARDLSQDYNRLRLWDTSIHKKS
jgi:hypothetical protein